MSKLLPKTGTLKLQYNTKKTIEAVNKKALFESIFVDTPFHSKLFSQLDALRLQGLVSKGVCHRALLCLAPPATGKTSVAERYTDWINSKISNDEKHIPVLYVSLKNATTPKKLMTAMLLALGDIAAGRGGEELQKMRLYHLLALYRVEMIIVDEVHHLAYRRNVTEVVNALKSFLNDRVAPLAFLGTEEAKRLFMGNHELGQRISTRADIAPLPQNAQGRVFMKKFLEELNSQVKALNIFDEDSDFTKDDCVLALHRVSGGVMGRATRVLEAALEVSVRRGATRIETWDVSEAINTWAIPGGFCKSNPLMGA